MKFFKKKDILIIVIIIFFSVMGYAFYKIIFSQKPAIAQIYYKSKIVKTIDLTKKEDYIFSIPEQKNVVFHIFKDGSICFEKSDCPDKICLKSGKLNTVGESAACLPNSIVVKIVSKNGHNDSDIDMIVGK